MARCKDLVRGYRLSPLGVKIPVQPAPGQPMPGQPQRQHTVVAMRGGRKPRNLSKQMLTAAAALAAALQ